MIISRIDIDGMEFYLDDRDALNKIGIEQIIAIRLSTMTYKESKYRQLAIIEDYFDNLLLLANEGIKEKIIPYLENYERIKTYLESAVDRIYNSGSSGFIETFTGSEDFGKNNYDSLKSFCENIILIVKLRKLEITSTNDQIEKEKTVFEEFLPELGHISVLLQTGKDSSAMEKIIRFIDFSKKFSRLLGYYNMDTGKIEPESINSYNTLLSDLGEALGRSDSVLIGDLLEYEIAPAIENFFNIMTDNNWQEV
jgi:hypothetical protein